jgi:hypothetical protein
MHAKLRNTRDVSTEVDIRVNAEGAPAPTTKSAADDAERIGEQGRAVTTKT